MISKFCKIFTVLFFVNLIVSTIYFNWFSADMLELEEMMYEDSAKAVALRNKKLQENGVAFSGAWYVRTYPSTNCPRWKTSRKDILRCTQYLDNFGWYLWIPYSP